MQRIFTMRRYCRYCSSGFTIASSNHWFCGNSDCTRRRRKEDRAALKAARKPSTSEGSDGHLERAMRSGD